MLLFFFFAQLFVILISWNITVLLFLNKIVLVVDVKRVMNRMHWSSCLHIYQKMAVEAVLTKKEEACLL